MNRACSASTMPGHAGRPRPHRGSGMRRTYKNRAAPGGDDGRVRFDTKIAIVLRDDLETWQKLNVTAFLASGVAANAELLGEPYTDADGTLYTPMFRQPVLVFEADKAVLTAAHERAVARGLPMAVFTAELFGTGHDEANRAAVAAVPRGRAGPRRHRGARAAQRRRQDDQGRAAAPLTPPRRGVSRTRLARGGLQGLHAELVAGRRARAAGARPLDVERGGVARRVDPQAAHRRRLAHRRVEVGDVHHLQLRRRRGARLQHDLAAARPAHRGGGADLVAVVARHVGDAGEAAQLAGAGADVGEHERRDHRARRALGRAERAAQLTRAAVRHAARPRWARPPRSAADAGDRAASGPRRATAPACPPSTRRTPPATNAVATSAHIPATRRSPMPRMIARLRDAGCANTPGRPPSGDHAGGAASLAAWRRPALPRAG